MSETHDLTQRAEAREAQKRQFAQRFPQHITGWEEDADLIRDLSAALVQAEQEKADLKQALTEVDEMVRVLRLDMAAGRVKSVSEIAAEARLATQEAAIRQVEQGLRKAAERSRAYRTNYVPFPRDMFTRWADTLRAILPAEQTQTK